MDILFVLRRNKSFAPTRRTLARLLSTVAVPARLRFHVFFDGQNQFFETPENNISFYDTSDAALARVFSPVAKRVHEEFAGFPQARSYCAVKLFAVELLPPHVSDILILDSDLLPKGDVLKLRADALERTRGDRAAALVYATESQPFYRWALQGVGAPPRERLTQGFGFNGGVAFQRLDRLRAGPAHDLYYDVFSRLVRADGLQTYRSALPARRSFRFPMSMAMGDQTLLSIADALFPREVRKLFRVLPCTWNVQVCLYFYILFATGSHPSLPTPCVRPSTWKRRSRAAASSAVCFNVTDQTCATDRPQIVHFNTPTAKQVVLASNFTKALKAFTTKRYARECRTAWRVYPAIYERLCNVSWLLAA